MAVVGVLLAAGAGRRAGGPKALRVDPDGTSWLVRSVRVLADGGCDAVVVVLGCGADQARDLLAGTESPDPLPALTVVEASDWTEGMGASLRRGLDAVGDADAVVVHLVDLPDVTAAVVARLVGRAGPGALARATYSGEPGHPVLIGRDHLRPIAAEVAGDTGARAYLDRHQAYGVDCGDLATGHDRDGGGA